jgi:DNA-binding HxlR family transcriptional regulator
VKRTSFGTARCPVARSLDEIGDWWTLLIVRDALRGATRFSDFETRLGLAKNILSARLRKMVADGILQTRPAADRPDRREYHLTEKGRSLQIVLVALRQWGEANLFAPGEPITRMLDKSTGSPPRRLELQAQNGQPLAPEDVTFRLEKFNPP